MEKWCDFFWWCHAELIDFRLFYHNFIFVSKGQQIGNQTKVGWTWCLYRNTIPIFVSILSRSVSVSLILSCRDIIFISYWAFSVCNLLWLVSNSSINLCLMLISQARSARSSCSCDWAEWNKIKQNNELKAKFVGTVRLF